MKPQILCVSGQMKKHLEAIQSSVKQVEATSSNMKPDEATWSHDKIFCTIQCLRKRASCCMPIPDQGAEARRLKKSESQTRFELTGENRTKFSW